MNEVLSIRCNEDDLNNFITWCEQHYRNYNDLLREIIKSSLESRVTIEPVSPILSYMKSNKNQNNKVYAIVLNDLKKKYIKWAVDNHIDHIEFIRQVLKSVPEGRLKIKADGKQQEILKELYQ